MRRSRSVFASILAALLAAAGLTAYAVGHRSPGKVAPPPAAPQPASDLPLLKPAPTSRSIIPSEAAAVRVRDVVDGDTVTLEDGRKLRYLGIDTPEHGERFFDEAKRLNASLVQGRVVYLDHDVEKTDPYRRELAYLFVRLEGGGEIFVNAEILRQGLARMYTFPPNLKHVETFRACQKEAIDAGRGTWKEYVFNSEPYFVATPAGRAFHRPSCSQIAGSRQDSLTRYPDARAALDAGKSPCRTCKP